MLEEVKKNNPSLNIRSTYELSKLYRKLDIDVLPILSYSQECVKDSLENYYIPSDPGLESIDLTKAISSFVFDFVSTQAGWCCGGGTKMNGMEWHKSSEVIVACTDMLLFIGDYKDISNDKYNSKNAIPLFLKAGEVIELYPMTLHLSPLRVNTLFKAAIILPRGTNTNRPEGIVGSHRAINKWLLVHPENVKAIGLGSKVGIEGENLTVNYTEN